MRSDCIEHVLALHDPIRTLFGGKYPNTTSRIFLINKSLQDLFVITPLNWDEWKAVLYISLPVILIDEALKFVSQTFVNPPAKIKKE